jgi:hypothetical protein
MSNLRGAVQKAKEIEEQTEIFTKTILPAFRN